MTVYVVHEVVLNGRPWHDTAPAEEFGERRVLVRTCGGTNVLHDEETGGARTKSPDATWIEEAVGLIRDGLAGYTRDDHLVMIGAPKLIAVAGAVAARAADGFLRMLVWNNRSHRYEEVVAELWGPVAQVAS